jgi:phospholipase/carboxylesterase
MNRFQLLESSLDFSSPQSAIVESARYSSSSEGWPQSLFAPLHYEPNYAYPLIVWLHGEGDDERQLRRIMPLVSMRNYVAVGPRGVDRAATDKGYTWERDAQSPQRTEEVVAQAIEAASLRYHIFERRIFLAGFGAGGTAAMRLALSDPGRFAGVVSLGGRIPSGGAPLARLQAVRKLPLLMIAGQQSSLYPESQMCDDLRLLHTAGMSVNLRLYPCGDEIDPHMLADLDRWIMQQITSPAGETRRSGTHVHEN